MNQNNQIQRLVSEGALQLSLFDHRDLAEIQHPDYPGERLIVCRNPLLAAERAGWGGFPFYGIPVLDERGLKIAADRTGPPFDPTQGDRVASPESLAKVRRYMAARFPVLKDAPLAEARVCQYERTPDSNLILDRHPEWENVWIAGGSGHGFKLGPTVGRFLAARIADSNRQVIPAELRLA